MANMPTSSSTCDDSSCSDHVHTERLILMDGVSQQRSRAQPVEQRGITSIDHILNTKVSQEGTIDVKDKQGVAPEYDLNDRGWRRIVRNFTPSSVHLSHCFECRWLFC